MPLQGLFLRVRSSGVSITSMYHIRDKGSSFLSSFNGSRLLFNKVSMQKKMVNSLNETTDYFYMYPYGAVKEVLQLSAVHLNKCCLLPY